jgi:hypothetical protein
VWRHPDHPWTSCNDTQPAVNRRACQTKSLNKYLYSAIWTGIKASVIGAAAIENGREGR